MSKKLKAPWVVCYDGTAIHGKRPYGAECLRCCSIMQPPRQHVDLVKWIKAAKAFTDLHADCEVTE